MGSPKMKGLGILRGYSSENPRNHRDPKAVMVITVGAAR